MSITLALIFLLLAVGGIVVRKTYLYQPVHELKRRAAKHDPLASKLYRAAAYDSSLRSLLWLYIGLTSAVSIILLARQLPVWLSLLIVGPLLWVTFSLLPETRVTKIGAQLTSLVTPLIAKLLSWLHPLLNRSAEAVEKRYVKARHTRLFERDDLIKLIEQQQRQHDNRLSDEELEIAKRALSFSDYKVSSALTPHKGIKTIQADDTIGPVLINELHESEQEFVLVQDGKKGPVIGSLDVKQLGLKSNGKVRDLMSDTVYYLHENDSLSEALHAFFVTNHPMFVVVNSFEEFVGIISVENILKQLLGHVPGDDFDQYADLAAVAARHSKKAEPAEAEKDAANDD